MAKKSKLQMAKEVACVISIKVRCGYCLEEHDYEFNKFSVSSSENECETCGSHGYVELEVKCASCKKDIELDIKSW